MCVNVGLGGLLVGGLVVAVDFVVGVEVVLGWRGGLLGVGDAAAVVPGAGGGCINVVAEESEETAHTFTWKIIIIID